MVEAEKARKRQLEEELAEAEQREAAERSTPAPKLKEAGSREMVKGELSRVASESAYTEKKDEARFEKDKLHTPRNELPAHKPELGTALEEQAAVAKSREHQTPEEVRRDEFNLQSKAAELRERALEERVRSEKMAEEQKLFSEKFKGKKAPAPVEKKRIRRPPTAEEMMREEKKARDLELMRRKEEIRKKLEAQEAAKRKVVGRIEWLQLRISALLSRIRTIFGFK